MPKISVIVPVYNVEKYLKQCVDSILAQTFTDYELLLIDDGSIDNSGAICDAYAKIDKRVKVIHKVNDGVSSARNIGLNVATGEYITFCDSDDYVEAGWLDKMIYTIENQNADVVVCNFRVVNNDGDIIRTVKHKKDEYILDSLESRVKYCCRTVLGGNQGWEVWCRIFRADIIKKTNMSFLGNYAEDMCFVLEYSLHTRKIISIDDVCYNYRLRKGSIMRDSEEKVRLNEMNELSFHLRNCLYKLDKKHQFVKYHPIFHFLIMYNQYAKIVLTERYPTLKQYILCIERYNEWKKMTKRIKGSHKELYQLFGKFNSKKIILLSHYCLHGNWKRFQYESAIAYRYFIKEEK